VTTRQIAIGAGVVGLAVSGVILALVAFGVSGVMTVGETDLMYVLWPSSRMLIVGWRTTVAGISFTAFAIALNCLLYASVAILLRLASFGVLKVVNRHSAT
jgi:hypothetical protein